MIRRHAVMRFAVIHAAGVCAIGMAGFPCGAVAQDTPAVAHDAPENTQSTNVLFTKRVTLRLSHVLLTRALDSLARVSNVVIQYQVPMLARYKTPLNVDARDTPLGVVVERLLDGTGLRMIPDGQGDLAIVPWGNGMQDSVVAMGIVAGRIVDSATGRALNGATIGIAGTKLSATSADSGRFVIRGVPLGDRMMSVRLFGYRPTTRVLTLTGSERAVVRIMLASAPNILSGVVTTATGVQERRMIGNDVTVINADSVMKIAPIQSVTDLLENRVPGLTVQRTSGVPGAPSRIRLRGIGGGLVQGAANSSNDPIVIVDGIRIYARQSTDRDQNLAPVDAGGRLASAYPAASPLDQIDPNSIEKIEVFKGPSATSQWGSDAGNGVIVITTKRGRSGPTHLDGALSTGVEWMPGHYANPGYYAFGHGFLSTTSQQCPYIGTGDPSSCAVVDSVVRFQGANAPALSPFGRGTRQEGSASMSGGSETMTYSLSGSGARTLGYLRMPTFYQDLYEQSYGARPPAWMRRPDRYSTWGVNTASGIIPTSGLRVNVSMSLSNSDGGQTSAQNQLAFLSGNYLDTAIIRSSPTLTRRAVGAYVERSQSHALTSNVAANADWSRWTMVPLQATLGISMANREDRVETPFGVLGGGTIDTLGSFGIGHGQAITKTGTVGATLWPGRLLSASTGMQVTQSSTNDYRALADTLKPGVAEPTLFSKATQTSYATTTAGWFVEPRFNFNSRFFVSPGFRFDGGNAASGAGTGARSGAGGLLALFPKLNFSWIAVDREGQDPLGGILTTLRPRLAFGVAGVQPDPSWNLRLMRSGQDVVAEGLDGAVLSSLGNPDLRPERSREIEGGFDAGLWNGRLQITTSAYSKLRVDAIQQLFTSTSIFGGLAYYRNIGRVRNTGAEFTAAARIIETARLAWGVNASVSTNRNIVTMLAGDAPYLSLENGTRLQAGYPISGQWARPILGYRVNASGRLSFDDVAIGDSAVYLGSGFPKLEMPFSTDVSLWRGMVSLTAAFNYTQGLTQLNAASAGLLTSLYTDPNASLGQQAVALTASQCVGTPVGQCGGTTYGLVQTVNILRFSTLSLNYNVPRSMSTRLRLPRMSVALQARNLGLWTNYRGKDPDVNGAIVGESLSDSGQLPLPRAWTVRMTLGN